MKLFIRLILLSLPVYFIFIVKGLNETTLSVSSFNYEGGFVNEKNQIRQALQKEHNALSSKKLKELVNQRLQSLVLTRNVVLDSTIISSEKIGESYFVNICVNGYNSRLFAKLKCNEKQYEDISNFHFRDALVVANISGVCSQSTPLEIFIDDQKHLTYYNEDVLLTGTFLEAVELAAF